TAIVTTPSMAPENPTIQKTHEDFTMKFQNCRIPIVLLSLLLALPAPAADTFEATAANGVQIGEPVSAVSIDVDLRDLPTAASWRPGMAIKEAHKRQFFPPQHVNS